ncbi:3-phosphoshikimate 1-carboxyvinyltransferase [Clostridium felsineum]|uniref:3-phosphoshikimate 1-carboxyvinyltransferase n=1 Tax=Clostridium felsineum TaxID=36839 RepID=UPI00214D7070|nr:3-phosphoshikimate 1-carboxyvinyltransferase [Clostridium felsineum]MCR3759948.1 3-phosphoshikimate 1-carboxyvinyltransferase [Clostridium felsineum]
MNCVKIRPCELKGNIKVPSSKSLGHRAIICASLSEKESIIENVNYSKDIKATCSGMSKLGALIIEVDNSTLKIKRQKVVNNEKVFVDCNESGSTVRFLIPISLIEKKNAVFTGQGKLAYRPLDSYFNIFDEKEIKYSHPEGKVLPLEIDGKLSAGIFKLPGNISSQFISGLMFSLPFLDGDSVINITNDLESVGYVDMTIDMLSRFGVKIENNDYKNFHIKGNQKCRGINYKVEGDFSQAAFWLTAGILNGDIKCEDLNSDSLQGDKAIVDILKKMGGRLDERNFTAKKSETHGIVIDASQCPDLVPILSVIGALSLGTTKIINAARLRIKESDRLKAMTTELNKLGADIIELQDGLVINGKRELKGGEVESWNDHRIAMALAVAALKCEGSVTIRGSECVAKSYPQFWSDFKKLGGDIDEWSLGE